MVPNTEAEASAPNNRNKKVIFKNCAPFTDSISKLNNTQVDKYKYIYVVISMFNLIEYIGIFSKTSGSLRQYYRGEPVLNDAGAIIDFSAANNNGASFNFKQKPTGHTGNNGSKSVEIKFWRNLEMPLINCVIDYIPTWLKICF